MPGELPVYSPDARLLFHAPPEWVRACAGNLRLVVSRRGVVKRAYVREDAPSAFLAWLRETGRRSSYGIAYQQHLNCGRRTWALRGTAGSR